MLRRVAAHPGQRRLLIWHSDAGLVVGQRDRRLPQFDCAAAAMASEGLAVALRTSGGGVVAQGPGIFNVALASSQQDDVRTDLSGGYRLLTAPLLSVLADMGLDAGTESVPAAYCDGRYNLVAAGRKLAGTAQRRTTAAMLVHACINFDADDEALVAQINRFHELAGSGLRHDAAASTSVAKALRETGRDCRGGRNAFMRRLQVALSDFAATPAAMEIGKGLQWAP